MAKNRIKKQSNRQLARLRYKIEKKVRDHNRKAKRQAKKDPKKVKQKIIEVPNICPFKGDILKEVALLRKQKEEEKLKLKEQARLERQQAKETQKLAKASSGLESLVSNAEVRGQLHETLSPGTVADKDYEKNTEQSLKQYYKEFRKVIEAADVVLEVVDARDPLGTRCKQVEEAVHKIHGAKRLVLVLNKADLVPRDILESWLKYLKKKGPVIAFKASVQNQNRNLGQRKFSKSDKGLKGSSSVGAELVMSLLANYCRNKDIKTSITVGVVGLPNVGKSSVINSLKRARVCNVGAAPGVTRTSQVVQLDSKIKLLDSPGIVFAAGNDSQASLRNAVKVSSISDPITPANAILQRVSKQQIMDIYDIPEFHSPEEFYSLKGARTGRFRKGGVPDSYAAARGLIEDWNSGKIPYYTLPPEEQPDQSSYKIVAEMGKEFDMDSIENMETDLLNKMAPVSNSLLKNPGLPKTMESFIVLESLGPVDAGPDKMETDVETNQLLSGNIAVAANKKPLLQPAAKGKKRSGEMALPGNLQLNQLKKRQFKKEKKDRARRERVALQLSAGLENFNLKTTASVEEDYNFDEDFESQSN
ncbi:guanine nucleotide-binding protein-like 3 homolog [Dendroctonus ponderosae]|uniref:Guanine nucleotide-binding protein-like 3 homolog n=1 Tax=Dendroctonus ponderosae TaxID=77166 RepID=U4U918_DENPD|nr:guanine nucleotide-binding protein-like 3 homolog [Dendroctonus ponderosae]ERL88823.1 hypothetical protein D910_06205 [Dendroctonus ponderosae]KAH1017964.1 hypothetical protein HUJ05_008538 [Dendroctonus ponderosae]